MTRRKKSIPLAPKQTQKLTITRKTVKKRSQKEVENNLRVLKDETSETNRAEQEAVAIREDARQCGTVIDLPPRAGILGEAADVLGDHPPELIP